MLEIILNTYSYLEINYLYLFDVLEQFRQESTETKRGYWAGLALFNVEHLIEKQKDELEED